MPEHELSFGRLVMAVLVVSPLAGFIGSFICGMILLATQSSSDGAGGALSGLSIFLLVATLVSAVVNFAVLLVLALPLTVALDRSGYGTTARDAGLILAALVLGGGALVITGVDVQEWAAAGIGWIVAIYTPTAALCWIAMLRYLGRSVSISERIEDRFL